MLHMRNKPIVIDRNFRFGPIFKDLQLKGLDTSLFYSRPHRLLRPDDSGTSRIFNTKDNFKISLDVQQFKPNELSVKIVDDFLVVEGKHGEQTDEYGLVSRQFTRRYRLPPDVDVQALQCSLSSDGVLQIDAPKKPPVLGSERIVPIIATRKPSTPLSSPVQPEKKKPKVQN
uniref:SHSP domain-containing protein n=1 Tax=Graphocephala atropunctata TaxID=36148 RepID=A0A1B6LKJ3_9HEMI